MRPAKPCSRRHTLKAPHRPDPLLDASMVLFQMIIQIAVRAMPHGLSQRSFDSPGIGAMSITGDALRDATGDRARGAEEGFRPCLVLLLPQRDIDEIPLPINGPVEVGHAPFHLDAGLVHVPAAPDSPTPMLAQGLT